MREKTDFGGEKSLLEASYFFKWNFLFLFLTL